MHDERGRVAHDGPESSRELRGVKTQPRVRHRRLSEHHVERAELESHGQWRIQSSPQDRFGRRTLVRSGTGDRLKENEGQRVDVAFGSGRFTNCLLGGKVASVIERHALSVGTGQPRERHVAHAHAPVIVEDQLGRREIAEDEALLVKVRERARDVTPQACAVIDAESSSSTKHVLERAAAEVFADHEDRPGLLTPVEYPGQVRMAQGRRANNPVAKGSTDVLVLGEPREQHFHRNPALQGDVFGFIDLGGLADTEQMDNAVTSREQMIGRKHWRHRLNHSNYGRIASGNAPLD